MSKILSTRIRLFLAALISAMPLNALRVFLYRRLMGYQIASKAKIGFGTLIAAWKMEAGPCRIGKFNLFIGPFQCVIGEGAKIGSRNSFLCGEWTLKDDPGGELYSRVFKLGRECLITEGHHFDLVGKLEIGDSTWIAGRGSQFWTHGPQARENTVRIGSGCYIGSCVRFVPGAQVGENSMVGLGSVVTKAFTQQSVLIAGNPAKMVKMDYRWNTTSGKGQTAGTA